MKKNSYVFLALTLSLLGCASISPNEFKGPNGGTAYYMKCSGMGRTMEACLHKAAEMCPRGYAVITSGTSNAMGIPAGNSLLIASQRDLSIECK